MFASKVVTGFELKTQRLPTGNRLLTCPLRVCRLNVLPTDVQFSVPAASVSNGAVCVNARFPTDLSSVLLCFNGSFDGRGWMSRRGARPPFPTHKLRQIGRRRRLRRSYEWPALRGQIRVGNLTWKAAAHDGSRTRWPHAIPESVKGRPMANDRPPIDDRTVLPPSRFTNYSLAWKIPKSTLRSLRTRIPTCASGRGGYPIG